MDNKQMPPEVAATISQILKFLEKSEKDYINDRAEADKEAKYENS